MALREQEENVAVAGGSWKAWQRWMEPKHKFLKQNGKVSREVLLNNRTTVVVTKMEEVDFTPTESDVNGVEKVWCFWWKMPTFRFVVTIDPNDLW